MLINPASSTATKPPSSRCQANKDAAEAASAQGPARCTVYIFKIACKVSGRELELPLGDPSPGADLILLGQPQQRIEFERTKAREGGRRANPPHKGREPLGSHAPRLPPAQRSFLAQELNLDFPPAPKSRAVQRRIGRQDPSSSVPFQEKLG